MIRVAFDRHEGILSAILSNLAFWLARTSEGVRQAGMDGQGMGQGSIPSHQEERDMRMLARATEWRRSEMRP